jgi:hypothetical protein
MPNRRVSSVLKPMMDGQFGIFDGWKEDECKQGNLGYGG